MWNKNNALVRGEAVIKNWGFKTHTGIFMKLKGKEGDKSVNFLPVLY